VRYINLLSTSTLTLLTVLFINVVDNTVHDRVSWEIVTASPHNDIVLRRSV